ncbi:23S rRNA pseudouridine2605 synthase [Chitinophaga sp. CF118]|uniref:pseudouridine synthase n=1 Tax=Chitinophaga sp. CF118 TaxID=1884367 RepID=UPI0008EBD339|nr:pseudouridine synthase [Chitinophaga sp. CF118]SFE30174.1 23S rRNA pseudouridine2605 synthase [Chitinophaga sp. CF118]
MKKNASAKKGFSPFKENKSSSNKKAPKPNNGAYRPRRTKSADDDARGEKRAEGDKPERGEWKRPERPEREKTDRKFGEKAPRSEGNKFWDKSEPKRTERNESSERPERGERTERKRADSARPERGDRREKVERKSRPEGRNERPERAERSKRPDGEREERKAFREKGERSEPRARIAGKPAAKKTANGRTPFKPRVQNDDSAFHSGSSSKDTRSEERSTPSGFNRKKFFDTANERFADKQDRKTERKPRRDDDSSFADRKDRSSDTRKPRRDDDSSFADRKDRSSDTRKPRRDDDSSFADRKDRSSDTRKPRRDGNSSFADRKDRNSDTRKPRRDGNSSFADRKDRDSDTRKPRRDNDSSKEFGAHRTRKWEEGESTVPGEMPLNKYIAHSGLCSRRKAVDFVKEGKVTVNGIVITEPATKVTAKDEVAISNKRINIQKNLVYILLNKPKGYITTTDDPEGRKTVMELIEDATTEERVYPVGRLDRNTSGLLLLTNDGELAQKLAHPKHNIRKIYHVGLDKPLTKADFDQIVEGVTLEDGVAAVDALGYVETNDRKEVGIEIHSGKNRIVRRIFEHLGYEVEKLDRVTYAGLTKKNVNRGKWRFLSEKEVILLKHFK